MFDSSKFFNGFFGKVQSGMCRLTMNGNIAIKCSNGYRTYNDKQQRLTNVTNFCFDMGSELFFVIPTMKVSEGDIILVEGKPKYVIAISKAYIEVVDYETAKEGRAIFKSWLIDDDIGSLCLNALHDALYGRLAEVVGVGFHRQTIETDGD